jgi:predicted nucleic-acid-binding Zn-ribbon protein
MKNKEVFVCPKCGSENNGIGEISEYCGAYTNSRICKDCSFSGLFAIKEFDKPLETSFKKSH